MAQLGLELVLEWVCRDFFSSPLTWPPGEHPARGKDAWQQLPASLVSNPGRGSGEWAQSSSLYGMEGVPLGTGCQPTVCEGTVIRLKLISKVDCS